MGAPGFLKVLLLKGEPISSLCSNFLSDSEFPFVTFAKLISNIKGTVCSERAPKPDLDSTI